MQQLHKAQISILQTLRHAQSAKYSQLMRPLNMESDVFKFHIRKLAHDSYIEKMPAGGYRLTPRGKEFANNLDKHRRELQKQPKLSLILVITRTIDGTTEYLCQTRSRQPYWGYSGFLSAPAEWGVLPEVTAATECLKQTGIKTVFEAAGFLRQRDFNEDGALLEDKLFQIMRAEVSPQTEVALQWPGGSHMWRARSHMTRFEKSFPNTETVLRMLRRDLPYCKNDSRYDRSDY